MAAAKNPAPSDVVKQIHYLAAALKAPREHRGRRPACRSGPRRHHEHRVLFAIAGRLGPPVHRSPPLGRLRAEVARLRRYGLIITDEVGYLPFEQYAANLVVQLVSSRYEHASLILTSNLPFQVPGALCSATKPSPPP